MFDIFAYCEIKSVSADFRIKRNGEVLLINADDGFLELKMLSPDIRKKFTLPQELSERLKKYFIHLATGESFHFLGGQ